MQGKICAGIVTYNPDIELFSKCLYAIGKQVDKVYLFDNGSENATAIGKCLSEEIISFFSEDNKGIAIALNELCKAAEKDGYDWIVTMDQDSICDDEMIETLSVHINNDSVGIIAPRVEFRSNGIIIHETRNKKSVVEEIRACITSGSLTRIGAWRKIGGFDEWMFIDHVDNEFCTHLIIEGYKIIRDNNAVIFQRAGEMKYLSLIGGRKILLPYYSEFRNYYICRNTIYYLYKYRKYINYWHDLGSFIYSQAVKVIFEKNRLQTIKSTAKGIKDGKAYWRIKNR